MKKILCLLALTMVFFAADAQTAFRYTTANPTGAYTNTAVDTMTYTLAKSYSKVTIQPVITRATGTQAGTAILACSVNGTNYVNTDTLTFTNAATNTTVWEKASAARYWRIIRSGATTVTGTSAAKLSVTP